MSRNNQNDVHNAYFLLKSFPNLRKWIFEGNIAYIDDINVDAELKKLRRTFNEV